MCRACADSPVPPPAGPRASLLLSSQAQAGRPGRLGQKGGTEPGGWHSNRLPGKAQPCSYFPLHPKKLFISVYISKATMARKSARNFLFLK